MYADYLRGLFPELNPVVDDLFLLEAHEVSQLPERAPRPELAAVLAAHPKLYRYLASRYPPIEPFLSQVIAEHSPSGIEIARAEDDLVWELADLIVYERAPALYDAKAPRSWTLDALEEAEPLQGKVIVDAGAGTGQVTFAVARPRLWCLPSNRLPPCAHT